MCPYLFMPQGFASPEQMHSQPVRGCWSLCSAPAPPQPLSPWPRGHFAALCGCCGDRAGHPSACPAAGALLGAPSSAQGAAGSPPGAPLAYLRQPLQSQAGCCTPSALGDAGSSSVVPHKEFLSLIILHSSHNPAKKFSVRFKSTSSPVPLSPWPLALSCVPHSSACSPAASWCFLHPCPAALWAAL